jgi:ankyrin repeat protein
MDKNKLEIAKGFLEKKNWKEFKKLIKTEDDEYFTSQCLIIYAKYGEESLFNFFTTNEVPFTNLDEEMKNFLHFAIENDNFELIKLCTTHDSTLWSIGDTLGNTPFHILFKKENFEKNYLEILQKCYNLSKQTVNKFDENLVHFSIKSKQLQIFKFASKFFEFEFSSEILKKKGWNLFHYSIVYGSLEISQFIFDHYHLKDCSLIHCKDNDGNSPILLSAMRGDVAITEWIWGNGGHFDDMNTNGNTMIHIACEFTNLAYVKYLLNHGAKTDVKNQNEQTCMYFARKTYLIKNDTSIIDYLLDIGVEIEENLDETLNKYKSRIPYLIKTNAISPTHITHFFHVARFGVEEFILKNYLHSIGKTNIFETLQDEFGRTFFQNLVQKGRFSLLKNLLDNTKKDFEIQINYKDNFGFDILQLSVVYDQLNILKYLQEKTEKNVSYLLALAIRYNRKEIIQHLFTLWNLEVNYLDNDLNTPLHIACYQSNYQIIEKLLKNKADPNMLNSHLFAPIDIASKNIDRKSVELLLSHKSQFPKSIKKDSVIYPLFVKKYEPLDFEFSGILGKGATGVVYMVKKYDNIFALKGMFNVSQYLIDEIENEVYN